VLALTNVLRTLAPETVDEAEVGIKISYDTLTPPVAKRLASAAPANRRAVTVNSTTMLLDGTPRRLARPFATPVLTFGSAANAAGSDTCISNDPVIFWA